MEKEKYLRNLIMQFKAATGINASDMSEEKLIETFTEWKSRRKILGENYIALLENMGLFIDDATCAEVGKGKDDSVVLPLETTIITPFMNNNVIRPSIGKVIDSHFEIITGVPTLRDSDRVRFQIIRPDDIKIFMTQNPYNDEFIKNWTELHNNRNNGIIVGIYGNTYDKDKEEKIHKLRELRHRLVDDYIEDYNIGNETYCYAIATDMLSKKRRLRKR